MSAEPRLRSVALAHGIVGLATCLCLLVFYAGADSLGAVNDVGNAVFGVLSFCLAWLTRPPWRLLWVAGLGTVLTIVGTVLVMSETTGFYLAGLWSGFGFALIGVWLVWAGSIGRLRRAGLIAGAVMMLGLIGVPGIAMGIDVMETAPAWTFVAGFGWAGTYLLFPAWSLRLAGRNVAERGS
ncbi:hypothetical protein [Kribbella speibonae]|uniref:DUF2306 domain-containing protein n=1 Tax=Kribbella speibonae TaxID=1572660 RepID=A0A4R0IWA0_9ACTN|nr:hypothetical protein [Kribbella speibonae]TCC25517.1 hypothetical protein E0H58_15455 [Kribbella speibonae]TCC37639.1 hypothetical protein E0H92_14125 [Kribbella speibonae]